MRSTQFNRFLRLAAAVLLANAWTATAQEGSETTAPLDISYQGQLLAAEGAPLNGTVGIQVRIYANAAVTAEETSLFIEDHVDVPVVDGVFSILVGQGDSVAGTMNGELFAEGRRYLEVHVNGERLEPRQAISSVPYALHADNASTVGGLTAAQLLSAASVAAPLPRILDVHGNFIGVFLDIEKNPQDYGISVFHPALESRFVVAPGLPYCTPAPGSAIFRIVERSFFMSATSTRYTELDCQGQRYIEFMTAGRPPVLAGAEVVPFGTGDCENPDRELIVLDPTAATLQYGREFVSRLENGVCTNELHTSPEYSVAADVFDPATLGFPYPIEGPLRMGINP